MKLQPPFCITPRLLPGLHISDGSFISIDYSKVAGTENRIRFLWYANLADGQKFLGNDIQSGCGQHPPLLQAGMRSFVTFLVAAAGSWAYRDCDWTQVVEDDNATMFPKPLVEWAGQYIEELCALEMELT